MPGLTAGMPMSCGLISRTGFPSHAHTCRHTQRCAQAIDRQTCLSAMLEGPWLTAVKPALPPTKKKKKRSVWERGKGNHDCLHTRQPACSTHNMLEQDKE